MNMLVRVVGAILLMACSACGASGGDDPGGGGGTGGTGGSGGTGGTGGSGGSGGGTPTPTCSETNDSCTGESICIGSACEDAFPRVYDVVDLTVTVPTTKPDGSSWDALGGAPDLFVVLSVDGTTVVTSETVDDTFSAQWPGPAQVTLQAGSTLDIQVFDEDVAATDAVTRCTADPITTDLLRGRGLACSSSGYELSFEIEPR